MRSLVLLTLLLAACTTTASVDDTDTDIVDADTSDTGECALEGEPCRLLDGEDYLSNCCNGRHTCFPEGCYYTQP